MQNFKFNYLILFLSLLSAPQVHAASGGAGFLLNVGADYGYGKAKTQDDYFTSRSMNGLEINTVPSFLFPFVGFNIIQIICLM